MCRERWQPPLPPARAAVADAGADRPIMLTVYSDGGSASVELDAAGAVNLARDLLDAAARRLKQ